MITSPTNQLTDRPNRDAVSLSQRRCLVTGKIGDKSILIRFVGGPDGALVVDLAQKLGGRGIWVVAEREAIEKAISKNMFARGLKQSVTIAPNFITQLETQLEKRIVQRLSLMRRAGLVVIGGGKIRENGKMQGLLIADDASAREAGDLCRASASKWIESNIPARLLGQAAGRDSIAYAGVIDRSKPGDLHLVIQLRAEILRWRGIISNKKQSQS